PIAGGRARRRWAAFDGALWREAALAFQEQLHPLTTAQTTHRTGVTSHQTRLFFGGRHPLCGIGVRSTIAVTSSPAACSERMAASRPAPGPRTNTLTWRMPCSMALRAALSAARPAA